MATYYAALELLKEAPTAGELSAIFADVPVGAFSYNDDGTVTLALSNGFALHFKIADRDDGEEGKRVAVDIFTIMHVSSDEETEREIDQL